jgi:outer membrane protein assembly factor BamB
MGRIHYRGTIMKPLRLSPEFLPAAFIFLATASVSAQEPVPLTRKVVLPDESSEAAARLKAADRLIETAWSPASGAALLALTGSPYATPALLLSSAFADQSMQQDWSAALEEYQRMIYDDGDVLALYADSDRQSPTARSMSLRRLCHLRIAAAPPYALALYRKRVDVLAQKLFRQGEANRDTKALERLVSDLFCSGFTDRALALLGDFAFEGGDFARAAAWWRLLARPASEARWQAAETLLFPGPQVDLARVRAKLILACAFAGERWQAEKELRAFRTVHGKARGKLAGRDGEYADIVENLISRLPALVDDEPWSTFAGNPERNPVLTSVPSRRSWADGPAWRVPLPTIGMMEPGGPFSRLSARLYYHPVIADDRVLLTDGRSVTGYDLLNGRLLFRYYLQDAGKATASVVPPGAVPRHTLTVSGDRVYARLGEQAIGPNASQGGTFLACLEMPPSRNDALPRRLREVWTIAAPEVSQFEGAPLVHEGFLYVALSRVENHRTRTSVHCYHAQSGKLRWSQEICDAAEFEEQATPRYHHHLLTLAAENIVYCSHSGAIVAVNRESGKPAWAVRYPGRKPERGDTESSARDLCPCVFHFGRIFVAPADTDRVFCLEASSGRVLWDRDRLHSVNLLGVAGGKLVLTEPRRLRALDDDTGLDSWQPGDGDLTFGRGLLAGDRIFWPTRRRDQAVLMVTQQDGEQLLDDPTRFRQIHAGNMAFGNGCLVVAGTDYLFGYVPPERLWAFQHQP